MMLDFLLPSNRHKDCVHKKLRRRSKFEQTESDTKDRIQKKEEFEREIGISSSNFLSNCSRAQRDGNSRREGREKLITNKNLKS